MALEFGELLNKHVLIIVRPTFKKFGILTEETTNFITLRFADGREQKINKVDVARIELDQMIA
jgi:hypothetical protein